MKIVLIGASGFVGKAVLKEAATHGHEVTAIARNTDKIEALPGVTAVAADASDTSTLAKAIAGHDVVISAYNPGWGDPEIRQKQLSVSKDIIEAAKSAGVRLIMIGGAGSLEIQGKQLVDSPEFPAEWKEGALGARDALTAIRGEKDLEWTFLSPAIHLAPGERTGKYRLGTDSPVFDEKGESSISVEDMAVAIVKEAESPKHIGKRFTLGY
jgi:putative NADH-flavin reductase